MDFQRIFEPRQTPPFPLTFLNDLGEATIRVEEKYCSWANRYSPINQKTERVFSYELYHQLRLLTENNINYETLRLDGEIGKQLSMENLESCGSVYNITQARFSPDLVIHLGQTDQQEVNQKLIVEIKTKSVSNKEIAEAIIKLNHYIKILNFQYSVLISVNTNSYTLIEQLQSIFTIPNNRAIKERFKRIIVINYSERLLQATTLSKILTT